MIGSPEIMASNAGRSDDGLGAKTVLPPTLDVQSQTEVEGLPARLIEGEAKEVNSVQPKI